MTVIELDEEDPEKDEDADLAPDFSLESLNGDSVSLSDYRGKAVMINFWATWCPPCRAEMPLIQDFADQFADELVVLAVNAGEHRGDVAYFVEEHGFDLVFLLDPENSVATLFNVRGFPTTLFIDQQGVLQATFIGEMDEAILSTHLEKIGLGE
jgi:thiol-disulfide isomerase/thioredoxin